MIRVVYESVMSKLHEEFDAKQHPLLFEYIDHWMYNNERLEVTIDQCYEAIRTSAGVTMYLAMGEIPEIDD